MGREKNLAIFGGRSSEKSRKQVNNSVGAYAVQCGECFKWRLIPTQEEYETIRHNLIEEPWFCSRKQNVSCDDPGDLDYDASKLWVVDKPNIPKPPRGTERGLVMRRDLSKMDAHYVMPNGKKVRSPGEVEKFLEANPEYQGKISVSSFNFTVPKIPEDMVPRNLDVRGSASSSKKMKKSKDEDD